MPKFDLKLMSFIKGKQSFYQLTINDNPDFHGVTAEKEQNELKCGVLDQFEDVLESKYQKDLKMIYAFMDRVANNLPVSGKKYHELTDRPKGDTIKDFEFKHGDLRVYCFKISGGKLFAVAGYKNTQDQDVSRLRSLKFQVIESLKLKL